MVFWMYGGGSPPHLCCNTNCCRGNFIVNYIALKNEKLVNALVYGAHSDLSKESKVPQKFKLYGVSGETLSNCRLMQNIQHDDSCKWSL